MKRLVINGWQLALGSVGQGTYARRLVSGISRHADRARWSVTIYAPSRLAPSLAARFTGLRVESLPVPRTGHVVLDYVIWCHRLLSHRSLRDPEVIFFSPGPCCGFKAPKRCAVTHHDCINHYYPIYMGRKFVRRWAVRQTEKFLHRARIVFTESEHAAADIHRILGVPKDRVVPIPAWLPPEFNPAAARSAIPHVRARYGLPARYWLYVGGYDVRKNVEFLIRAYAAARRMTDCPPLVLAGRIPERVDPTLCDVAGARAESGLPATALPAPGFIDDADLPGVYAGAELFLYPSLMEGYGLPPLEAMGCGCPAWVADNSSLREVVRDADYRFAGDDLYELARRLADAARAPVPLNPSFDPRAHDEAAAIGRYLKALAALGDDE